MAPEHPGPQRVEGAHPQPAGGDTEQAFDAAAHLTGGLVGKGHRHDGPGGDIFGLHQPGNAVHQYAGLAAAGPGQHQHVGIGGADGGALGIIQGVEYVGDIHRGILANHDPHRGCRCTLPAMNSASRHAGGTRQTSP